MRSTVHHISDDNSSRQKGSIMRTHDRKNARARFIVDIFFLFLGNYLSLIVSSCSAKGSCLTVIRSKSQFWSILYTWGWSLHPRANRVRLCLSLSFSRASVSLSFSLPLSLSPLQPPRSSSELLR